jgi:hypothetical protein
MFQKSCRQPLGRPIFCIPMKVGLTLSGEGIRAAVFHVGVLRRLAITFRDNRGDGRAAKHSAGRLQ